MQPTPATDAIPTVPRGRGRLLTYGLFAGLVVAGLVLEKGVHEMHFSKLLIFAAVGVWARELRGRLRWTLILMVVALEAMLLVSWFTYRHQHLVPLGNGVYRISNDPNPTR